MNSRLPKQKCRCRTRCRDAVFVHLGPLFRDGRREEEIDPLTPRELEVLALLARGQKNVEIAGRLSVSERTVKFHVSSLMHKLGAENRTEAVTLAAQRGLIRLTD